MTGDRTAGRLPASVYEIDADAVDVVARDGRRWSVARSDFPPALAFVGQSIFLVHDGDGFVTRIESRPKDPLPPELQARIDAILDWADGL
jgi:hypothetical protein